jgi:beta-1,4-mannosyltransferase
MADRSWHYLNRLATGLRNHGIEIDLPAEDHLSGDWLKANRRQVRILHFHWTQYHYLRSSWIASAKELVKFALKLVRARLWDYKVVWTVHNLLPHERPYPVLDRLGRWIVACLADSVIVHCEFGRQLLGKRFKRRKNVYTIPLGNFIGVFPDRVDRDEARALLGVHTDHLVFLFLGGIRPYKGLPKLLHAFRQVSGDNLRLIVAGSPPDPILAAQLQHLAQDDRRVRLDLNFVPAEDISVYYRAADFSVLPYEDILTSAAAVSALSFDLPVVAPRLGCLPELITPECGLLYNPASETLQSVLERCLDLDLAAMRLAARARAEQFPWDQMVHQTAEVYRQLVHSEASQRE